MSALAGTVGQVLAGARANGALEEGIVEFAWQDAGAGTMRSNLALWQTVAVVASGVGLLSACGLGASGPSVPPPPPVLLKTTVSPHVLVFAVDGGTPSQAQTITLTNVSSAAIKVDQTMTRAGKIPKFLTKSDCDEVLAAGASCTVEVIFRSEQKGRFSSVLGFQIDNGQLQQVRLLGEASTPETASRWKQ